MHHFLLANDSKQPSNAEDSRTNPVLRPQGPCALPSGNQLDTRTTFTELNLRGVRNITRRDGTSDLRNEASMSDVFSPRSRLTPKVIADISAAVLRQHRALMNLPPESRARLPLHLHRMQSISNFNPVDDLDLDSGAKFGNQEIPIVLTTFHTDTEDPQNTSPDMSNTCRTLETQPSKHAWLDLADSDGEEEQHTALAQQVGGERRPPGDTSWLGDLGDSSWRVHLGQAVSVAPLVKPNQTRPLLPIAFEFASRGEHRRRADSMTPLVQPNQVRPLLPIASGFASRGEHRRRAVSMTPLVQPNQMRPSLPIASQFPSRGELGFGQVRNTNVRDDGTKIENTKSDSANTSFKVFPRNAVHVSPVQRTVRMAPISTQPTRIPDWLDGISLGRSGETPSTSESGRTKSFDTDSTATTTLRSLRQAVNNQITSHRREGTRQINSEGYLAPDDSRARPNSKPRYPMYHRRLSTIVDVSPPQDHETKKRPEPPRDRRRKYLAPDRTQGL